MIKIAISGKLGAGKSEFLRIANESYPWLGLTDAKFAGPIYSCLHAVQHRLDLPQEKDGKVLQFLGSHYREKYGNKFWVKKFFENALEINHIVTDLRFPEEFEACKQRNYILVRIKRQDDLRLDSAGNRDINHISETALDSTPDAFFDFIINNNGSMELLESAVHHIMGEALRRYR